MIGDRLRELRLSAGLNQPEFAAIAGTTKQYVGRLENGSNKTPNPKFIEAWAKHCNVRMEWITSGALPKEAGSRVSQAARPDFEMIASAVNVLRHYLELVGDPPEWIHDPVLLETAYMVAEEFGKPIAPDNVLDLTKILAKRMRVIKDVEEHQVRGTRTAVGR